MKAKNWILFAILVAISSGLYALVAPKLERGRHFKHAEARLTSYTSADWAALYGESLPLIENVPVSGSDREIPPKEWPFRIRELEPYYVASSRNELIMGWTDGRGNEAMFLFVHGRKPPESNTPESEAPGIEIDGPKSLPKRPYTERPPETAQ